MPNRFIKRLANRLRFLRGIRNSAHFNPVFRFHYSAWPRGSRLRKRPYIGLVIGEMLVPLRDIRVLSYPFDSAKPYLPLFESPKYLRAIELNHCIKGIPLDPDTEIRLRAALEFRVPENWTDVCLGFDDSGGMVVRDGLHRLIARRVHCPSTAVGYFSIVF